MQNDLLVGLSRTLRALATAPHPDALAAALVDGLAEPLGVRIASILAALPPRMVILGHHGYEPDEIEGLDWIPLDDSYPVPRAYRDGEILIEDTREMPTTYEGMRRLGGRTRKLIDRLPTSCIVSVPIVSGGRPVGGYALHCERTTWTTLDISALDAIGNALGLWLTHPDSGLPTEDGAPPRLTPRQQGVLSMLAGGMSNPAIAQALGVSESTVKQEVRNLLTLLSVDDRRGAIAKAVRLGILEGDPS